MSDSDCKHILIIEAQMKQYRAAFYARLYQALRSAKIRLTVYYSDPTSFEASKNDNCVLPDEYGTKVKGYWFFNERLLYQPLFRPALNCDLVIIDQGNRFLLNHALLPLSRLGLQKVGFWGLGENRQAGRTRISEWYRRSTLNWVSWWFAYTKGTARYLIEMGVPASKITAVENSVDTGEIRRHVASLSQADRNAIRKRLGIPAAAPVGIFCGMLDPVKSVPFLIDACHIVRSKIPQFHLLLVGSGPEQRVISELIKGDRWIHLVGPRFGKEKADLLAVSDAFLLPGRVGLAVLDAFAAGLPLLTTRRAIHGPEIEYLEEGVNGLISDVGVRPYAEAVSSLFGEMGQLSRLQGAAAASANRYSIENMVANFKIGIQACLSSSKVGFESARV